MAICIRRLRISRKSAVVAVLFLVAALQVVPGLVANSQTHPATDAELEAYVSHQLADAGLPAASLAIVRDGHLEHSAGFGIADSTSRRAKPDTPFVIGSLSKGLTALAVLRLVESGVLDLEAPAVRYLPAFRTADAEASASITVRQLLHQTSGLPASAVDLSASVTTIDGAVARFADVELSSSPGNQYGYSNANYVLLGAIVQAVTGQPYAEAMTDLVFRPLGMTHTSADLPTAESNGLGDAHRLWFGLADSHRPLFRPDVAPAGFVTSTAVDLARVQEMVLAGGQLNGSAFLSPTSVRALTTGVADAGPAGRYAMGWIETTLSGEPALMHDGSTTDESAVQIVLPRQRLAVVILTNGQSVLYELFQKTSTIGRSTAARLAGLPPTGTLEAFYLVFDIAILLLFAFMGRGLYRAVAAARKAVAPSAGSHARTVGWRVLRLYLDLLVPLGILWRAPAFLAAPWWILVRTDLGLVLFAFAIVRLATGGVRLVGWARSRRLAPTQSVALDGDAPDVNGVTVRPG